MIQYLQLLLSDIAQLSPLSWCVVLLATFVIGMTVGAFMVGEER